MRSKKTNTYELSSESDCSINPFERVSIRPVNESPEGQTTKRTCVPCNVCNALVPKREFQMYTHATTVEQSHNGPDKTVEIY